MPGPDTDAWSPLAPADPDGIDPSWLGLSSPTNGSTAAGEPHSTIEVDEVVEQVEAEVTRVDDGSPLAGVTAFVPATSPNRGLIPTEPWFYGWLDGLAKIAWDLAKLVVLLVFIAAFIVAVVEAAKLSDRPILAVLTGIFVVIASTVSAILILGSIFVWSALLRLAVDVARNIREIRYR